MIASIIRAAANRRGVTAAEYAVMAVAIVLAVSTAAAAFSGRLVAALSSLLPA